MAELYQVVVTIRGMQRNHANMLAKELRQRYVQEEEETVNEHFKTTVEATPMPATIRSRSEIHPLSGSGGSL